jgi:hypothetical protein
MIAVGVGDENVRHRLVSHGIEQRADMGGIVRTRVKDRNLAAADDVTDGAFECERTRIVGHDPTHTRHRLVHDIGREFEVLVERNIVVHAVTSGWRNRPTTISATLAPR